MRFAITPAQLKKLAHRLNLFVPAVPLSQLLEAIAKGCGHKSWHDVGHAAGTTDARIPISPHRVGDDESAFELKHRIRDVLFGQLAAAFAQAPFGTTFPMLQDPVMFPEVLERVGFVEDCSDPLRRVRAGRARREVASPFYSMSLTTADDELAESGGAPIANVWDFGVSLVTQSDLRSALLKRSLARYVQRNWSEHARAHIYNLLEQPDRTELWTDGQRSWPLALLADDRREQAICLATWQQVTPHAQPIFEGVLQLHAVSAQHEQAVEALAEGGFRCASWGLTNALWAMTGCTDAQVRVEVRLSDDTVDQTQLAAEFVRLIMREPAFQGAQARLVTTDRLAARSRRGGVTSLP
jgi:hypothetical protein